MIIQCNSCEKRFVVPDNAITAKGRLVQCSSCGNKWTQFPSSKKEEITKINEKKISQPREENIEVPKKTKKNIKTKKPTSKKIKRIKQPYTKEYLKIKHGINIDQDNNSYKFEKKLKKSNFGFYNYLITTSVFLIFISGLIYLFQDLLILQYPFLSVPINYFFESLINFKTIIIDLISTY